MTGRPDRCSSQAGVSGDLSQYLIIGAGVLSSAPLRYWPALQIVARRRIQIRRPLGTVQTAARQIAARSETRHAIVGFRSDAVRLRGDLRLGLDLRALEMARSSQLTLGAERLRPEGIGGRATAQLF